MTVESMPGRGRSDFLLDGRTLVDIHLEGRVISACYPRMVQGEESGSWYQAGLGSNPGSATNQLCSFRQITQPL